MGWESKELNSIFLSCGSPQMMPEPNTAKSMLLRGMKVTKLAVLGGKVVASGRNGDRLLQFGVIDFIKLFNSPNFVYN